MADSVKAAGRRRALWRRDLARLSAEYEVVTSGETERRTVYSPRSSASTADETDDEENTDEERQQIGGDICPNVLRIFPNARWTTAKNFILDIASRTAKSHYKNHPEWALYEL